jgi:hypothetical protein
MDSYNCVGLIINVIEWPNGLEFPGQSLDCFFFSFDYFYDVLLSQNLIYRYEYFTHSSYRAHKIIAHRKVVCVSLKLFNPILLNFILAALSEKFQRNSVLVRIGPV